MRGLMENVKSQARVKVHNIMEEWPDKWTVYEKVFYEMDKGRITLDEICVIAEGFGIPADVVRMRRRDFIGMAGSLQKLKNNIGYKALEEIEKIAEDFAD
tara:strand:- start:57 stop:356 length:300 start_codon:yes stop_codon:yes gene_type:complete